MAQQTTLLGVVHGLGIGLHSGQRARLTMRPARPGTGVVFVRADITDRDNVIPALADNVTTTRLGTTIANAAGAEVQTVEHLMSAIFGAGLDNVVVELDGPEIPIMDGSADGYMRLIDQAGKVLQGAPRRRIEVLETIFVEDGSKWAALDPGTGFCTDVEILFQDPAIGRQRRLFRFDEFGAFAREIAPARTFGFMRDVEAMRAAGLARGGSMDNAIVIEEGRVLNPEGLRFADEFVRHKILDAVGDLALLGARIEGTFRASQPGHYLNNLLARAVLANPGKWRWTYDRVNQPVTMAAAE